MTNCQDVLGPTLETILQCAADALAECGRLPGLVHLAPGAVVSFDNCCEPGGQLWVRLIEIYPSGRPFPALDSAQQCGITELAMRVGVGVIRCAHTLDADGTFPTAAELTSDALNMTADASILLDALLCCVPDQVQISKIDRWTPLGPDGGCVGGEWSFFVGVPICPCE